MRGRRSIRLKGHDYREPGAYFVTVCTKFRGNTLGKVVSGRMELNVIGDPVDRCWRSIPDHHAGVRLGAYQIMPDHLHGIIILGPTEGIGDEREPNGFLSRISPRSGSLSTIVRSFKSAVTREVHLACPDMIGSIWQAGFYDSIIRDDVSHYFMERYISLNPLVWLLECEQPEEEIERMKEQWQIQGD